MSKHKQDAAKNPPSPVTPASPAAPDPRAWLEHVPPEHRSASAAPDAATAHPRAPQAPERAATSTTNGRMPNAACTKGTSAMIHDDDCAHIHENDDACPAPDCCALCGTPARYFPLQASLLLDWVLTLQGDVASLQDEITSMDDHLRGLKQIIEEAVLP
jgi:hypothetical protein